MEGFYTVSQYAELTGKDPGNIRRMLIRGELQGEKAGNQWMIPKDVEYPADKRVKSGDYKNWRKRKNVWNENKELMKNISSMCGELRDVYGNSLKKIVLYGSYARGEQTPESDVDIALIVNNVNDDCKHDKMTDIVVDYELEQGVTLSVIQIDYAEYTEWNHILPFYKNIDKEGIVLWKSA